VGLSLAYQSMNVPPWSDPIYLDFAEKWLGGLAALDQRNSFAQIIGRSNQSTMRGEMATRFLSAWKTLFNQDINQAKGAQACDAPARLILGSDAKVIDQCTESVFVPGGCGPAGTSAGCANDFRAYIVNGKATFDMVYPRCAPTGSQLERYSWRTFAWKTTGDTGAGHAADTWCVISPLSYPLLWYFRLGREIATTLQNWGARQTIAKARLYVTAANARSALAAGLLTDADLAAKAAAIPADALRLGKDDPTTQQLTAGIALASLALVAVPPPVGPVAGAILGITAAILQVLPIAVGVRTDRWGRAEPVFLRGSLTGDIGTQNRPTHDVADAPAVTRPPIAPTTGPVVSTTPVTLPGTTPAPAPTTPAAFDPAAAAHSLGLRGPLLTPSDAAAHIAAILPPSTATTGGAAPAATPAVPLYKQPLAIAAAAGVAGLTLTALLRARPPR
jgi:hypothetical protein